jgi:AraC family transcriptional regulator of adaptative response / DNA-3-methyladenine glycosylase II
MRLAYRPPYDWDHVCAFLAMRTIPGVERIDANGYARTLGTENGTVIVSMRVNETDHALELRVRGAAPTLLFQLSAAARRMFDLSADPARIAATFSSDTLLAPLVKRRPGLRIPGAWDPFECAVRAVLGQQVSVAAARTLAARLVVRTGRVLENEADGLTHLFPSPADLASASLDGLGITGSRIRALQALARAVADKQLDFSAGVDEVIAGLTALPGFGAWTAQYIAMRALGEPDAFPTGDLVLRRMASATDKPLSIRELESRAEAWRPWRGYAVMHLWAASND